MSIAAPTAPRLAEKLGGIAPSKTWSVVPAPPVTTADQSPIAFYIDDLGRERAALLVPLGIAAVLAASLLGLPASRVAEVLEVGVLEGPLEEAFEEACNILGSALNSPGATHLRFARLAQGVVANVLPPDSAYSAGFLVSASGQPDATVCYAVLGT